MSLNIGSAIGYLDLDTSKFQNGLRNAQTSLGGLNAAGATTTDKFKAMGGALTSVGAAVSLVSVPLLGLGATSLKTAADFESGMSKVSALSGVTGTDLEMLEQKAKDMGASTKFSATEALGYMALAGWDAEQMAAGLEPSLKLAGAAGMELGQATDIVTDTMSMFGMEANEATKMTDMLAYAQANSNTDVQMLGEALKYCGASANAMGYDLADTTALLGTFADQGLKGSSAGTTLNAMFRDMKDKAEKGAIAIGKTKVSIVDAQGNYRDMTDILADVNKATEGMTMAQRDSALSNIWGTQALKGINMAFEAGIPKINEFESSIRSSDGAANEMYETMQNNLKGSIDNMKSAFEGVLIVIGERLIPIFESVVKKVTDMLTWFKNLNPVVQDIIIAVGGFIAVLGPVLLLIGGLIIFASSVTTALGVLSAAFAAGGAAATIFGAAMTLLTGPVGIIIAVIAGVIAVGYLLIKNWDEICAYAAQVWENIKSTIDNAMGWICEKLGIDWELVKSTISQAWTEIWTNITDTLGQIWTVISDTWNSIFGSISEALGKIKEIINNAWNFIKVEIIGAIGEAIDALLAGDWEGFKEIISRTVDKIKVVIKQAWESIKEIISNLGEVIKVKIGEAWESIKTLVSNCVNGIKTSISNAWQNMKDTINNGMQNIKTICSTIWEGIKGDIKAKVNEIWTNIKTSFGNMVQSIGDSLSKAWDTAVGWWNKIKEIFKNPIEAVVNIFKKEKSIDAPTQSNDYSPYSTENDGSLVNSKFDYSRVKNTISSGEFAISSAINDTFKDFKLQLEKESKPNNTHNSNINLNINIDKVLNNEERDIEQLADELAFHIKKRMIF